MNVFITGATGVLGQPVTRLLLDTGHHVRALARTAANETRLKTAGAVPVSASLFDVRSLRTAIQGCDTVLHLATRIPPANQASQRKSWNENDRIRIEGTRNLVEASLDAGVTTFLYPGVTFIYPDGGAEWMDAKTAPRPASILQSSIKAEAEVERFAAAGKRGIVLRMGSFYGPASPGTQNMLRMARRGFVMIPGPAKAYQSLIWVDDAAVAVIDALARAGSGIYDVVDDEPLRKSELAGLLAQVVKRKLLLRPPGILWRILAGRHLMFLTRSQRVSNQKFKTETGWSPMLASAKDGFRLLEIPP